MRVRPFDDSAAYARIRAAMVPDGREKTETFLRHREEIFAAFGSHLWPDEEEAVGRKRIKATPNAYNTDAGANVWERRFGNPRKRTLRGVSASQTATSQGSAWRRTRRRRKAAQTGSGSRRAGRFP